MWTLAPKCAACDAKTKDLLAAPAAFGLGLEARVCESCYGRFQAEAAERKAQAETRPKKVRPGQTTKLEKRKSQPAAGVLLILGSLLSTVSGGHDPGHLAPINVIILIAGTVGAGLDFAGAARKTRIFSAALAFAGTLLVALTARGHYMLGHALALFDIGAVLTLLIGLCLDLGGSE
jgi:hypothetical protein